MKPINTTKNIFSFGETIEPFKERVLNEREIRASAGILFFFALVSFMNSWLVGDFYYTKIFVIAFLGDFLFGFLSTPNFLQVLLSEDFLSEIKNQNI